MKNNLFKLMLSLFAIVLFVGSCEEIADKPAVDTETATDNARSSRAVGDVFAAVESGVTGAKTVAACPIYASVPGTVAGAYTLSIDYGIAGCAGSDLVTRSGKIYAEITGSQRGWIKGTKAVVTFADFKLDGNPLTGGITITCDVVNDVKTFKIEATNLALTFTDNTKLQWSATSNMSLMSDNTGKYWKINGTSTGTSRKGIAFSNVSEALLTDPACKWFVGGTLSITAGDNVDVITFTSACGSVTVKHNNLPAIPLTLN